MIGQVIDGLILVLLIGTLGYAFLLDRRLRALMAALREIGPMVDQFSGAVDKSEGALGEWRSVLAFGRRKAEPPQPAPQTRADAAPRGRAPGQGGPMRTRKVELPEPPGVTRVPGKTEMVRGFFEASRERET